MNTTNEDVDQYSDSASTPHQNLPRWLITGGCGFIGTRLIKRLVSKGNHVIRILDNLSVGTKEDLGRVGDFVELDVNSFNSQFTTSTPTIELVVGDITDYNHCVKSSKGMDVIVHLAANTGVAPSVENPRNDLKSNVIGTFNMLEAAKQNCSKRFVFASSGAPIGDCKPPIHEELPTHPVSPYGASKLCGEAYCSAYYRTFGVETVVLRFGNVYGIGSEKKNSVVAKFILNAINGMPLEIYGDGNQTRDFIYIDDLIGAICCAATAEDIGGETFQIATSTETTICELGEKLVSALKDLGVNHIEMCHTLPRLGDVQRNFSDTSKAKKQLGWQAQVALSEGLKRTAEWFFKESKFKG